MKFGNMRISKLEFLKISVYISGESCSDPKIAEQGSEDNLRDITATISNLNLGLTMLPGRDKFRLCIDLAKFNHRVIDNEI